MENSLQWSVNPFGGVVINPDSLQSDVGPFRDSLRDGIATWRLDGFQVSWLEIPIEKVILVPVAVAEGFVFHHASAEYLMLTIQIKEGAFVPSFATHYVGIGGVVINHKRQILVVSERYRTRGLGPAYKLPGGALQQGEHLVDAAIREVFEETGVETRFESISCFRHWHGYRYGKSDIYFVSLLSPITTEINMQEEEIVECLWLPLEDYLGNENVSVFNKRIVTAALSGSGFNPESIEGYIPDERFEFFMPAEFESAGKFNLGGKL